VPSPHAHPTGRAVTPFLPDRLDLRTVAAVNRMCRRRAPLVVAVEGLALELRTEPVLPSETAAAAFTGSSTLDLTWVCAEGAQGTLTVPRGVIERVLSALEPGLPGLPEEPTRSLLIELALAPLLLAFERHSGTRLSLVDTRPTDDRAASGVHALAFWGSLDGVPFHALLRVDRPEDWIWALEFASRAADSRAVADGVDLSHLPVTARFRAGTLRLPLGALAGLQPGDILVPDDFPFERDWITVTIGHRSAPARVEAPGLHLADRLRPTGQTSLEFDMRDDGGSAHPAKADDDVLDDLQVTLVFELGRREIDLATLRTLAPGYVFPLNRDPEAPVDILANGRRIGRGEIVRVGDTLGVRATRLFGDD
jgi:type III secretion protein Q